MKDPSFLQGLRFCLWNFSAWKRRRKVAKAMHCLEEVSFPDSERDYLRGAMWVCLMDLHNEMWEQEYREFLNRKIK